jgi:uncharacterized protein (DUF924 family)
MLIIKRGGNSTISAKVMKNWSIKEQETIEKIRTRFSDLYLYASFAEKLATEEREKEAIAEARQEFEENLAKGILLDKFLDCWIC